MQPLAFVDIEVTGFIPSKARILEIGIFLHDEDEVKEWTTLINPEILIPDEAIEVLGITQTMVENQPTFSDIIDELETILNGRLIVSHNAGFNQKFFIHEYNRNDRTFDHSYVCTQKLNTELYEMNPTASLKKTMQQQSIIVSDDFSTLSCAKMTYQLWNKIINDTSNEKFNQTITQLKNIPA
jgi:DNA polymerase-3 subunit epsilon